MDRHGRLYISIVLFTLFFLVTACNTINTVGVQPTKGTTPTQHRQTEAPRDTIVTPVATPTKSAGSPTKGGIPETPATIPTLPPQTAVQPSPTPIATIQAMPIPAPTIVTGNTGLSSIPAAAQAILTLINQERAGTGKPALQMNNALINSAHLHDLKMVAANQLSHQLPGEAGLGIRITAQGVRWNLVAENIGYGFGDATQTALSLNQSMFAEKPPNDGHRVNILSDATIIGIDVVVNPKNSQVWLTEDFARIA